MSFIKRAIRQGISDAVGKAVTKAIEPKATQLVNKATQHIENVNGQKEKRMSGLESAMMNFEKAAQSYATEAAKSIKVCPKCEQPTTADKKFCPNCGTELPELTIAQGSVCIKCGTQNSIGTKFCQECGEKLPYTIQEEERQLRKDEEVLTLWDEKLPMYPKWNCGGQKFNIEEYDNYIMFTANFDNNHNDAREAVTKYQMLLQENGFIQAGQYPDICHLYKMIDEKCYHVDTEHCFDGDSDSPCLYFNIGEPVGGFNYKKPEPKKKVGFKDLLKF